MLFNSLPFLVFLPTVFLLYWFCPSRYRWVLLLIVSCYFYMCCSPQYVVILIFTTAVTYFAGRALEKTEDARVKKAVTACAVCVTLAFLVFFKYFDFFSISITPLLSRIFSLQMEPFTLKLVMPVGISFYTFMSVGYVADVYRGKIAAEKNFARYALFVSFFPQIVSGPIGRYGELGPQLDAERKFDPDDAVYALRLMMVGYFKKLIIADGLASYVDLIYVHLYYYYGLTLIVTAMMYSIEIYCDFSGYSDIAIGTARLFGIRLSPNFKAPYLSASIKEFWSRWHISLSTWFRDYVYIPLGGNRKGELKRDRNLLITFLTSGLWHGANWTYVAWGGLHGLYQIAENRVYGLLGDKSARHRAAPGKEIPEGGAGEGGQGELPGETPEKTASPAAERAVHVFKVIFTFGLVTLAWIFFRCASLYDVQFYYTHMHQRVVTHFAESWVKLGDDLNISVLRVVKLVMALLVLFLYDLFSEKRDLLKEMDKLKRPVRWLIYLGTTVVIIVTKLHGGESQQFIYFQF